jgi:hypothetical protein
MRRRSISRLATLALLAGLLVVLVPAARTELTAVRSQVASAHANAFEHADAVLVSSPMPVRHSIPPAQFATSVVVEMPTRWAPLVTCFAVTAVALLFVARRRRAPPRFLFA